MPELNESQTRALLINPQLVAAQWKLDDRSLVRFEIPVDGYDAEPWNGVTDYCLYDHAGNVLAVVEAKRTSRSPREADEQLRHYITEIAKRQSYAPFGFMANGREIWFWEVGQANPRLIAGFFTPEDLQRMLFLRQHAHPLEATSINTTIVDRPYQHEAIRRVAESFAAKKRRALLVMATGTGKTRTTMALIDLFLRAHQAQNVLFLADRDALVDQAMTDGFKAHLPHEPRDRVYTWKVDKTKRLFVATEQTMSLCYEKFSPGFFDLIIFDEAHRSIFKRFAEVIEYFDARMIGLTATPANFIDRDTFRVFNCDSNTPTFLYEYQQAVKDGFLVDFSLYQAQTGFQRKGIKGVDLTEEDRNALIEQGIDPDAIDYAGTEIEVEISNKDTLRKQLEEVMEACLKDQSGQLPGKTIVFAMTKDQAKRINQVFEEMYPQHVGLAQVITSTTERVRDGSYGDGLITKFKKKDLPRIAISVDMLDTGIDVPEVVNLIFMKPVQSRIKLWQMVGRGTRNQAACRFYDRLPDGKKTEFKIIDFWQNDFNKQADDKVPAEVPVLVSIFNTRLKLLEGQLPDHATEVFRQSVLDLRQMLNRIPKDSFPVRKVWGEIDQAWQDDFWKLVTPAKIEFLKIKVGPLLRFAANVDVAAETFTHKIERLKLQIIQHSPSPQLLQSIAEDVSLLPDIHERVESHPSAKIALSKELATAQPAQLTQLIKDLAPEMKNRRNRPSAFLKIDLPDFIETRGYISLGEGGKQIYVEEYKKRIESRILAIVENHPTLEAIRQGREVTDEQLVDLERTLQRELSGGELQLNSANIRKAYGLKVDNFLAFIRHLLTLDALPDSLKNMGAEDRLTAKAVLKVLVSSERTKVMVSSEDIAARTGFSPSLVSSTIRDLIHSVRLVREVKSDPPRFELAHESLADSIAEWLDETELRRRELQEMLEQQASDAKRGFEFPFDKLRIVDEHRNELLLNAVSVKEVAKAFLRAGELPDFWRRKVETLAPQDIIEVFCGVDASTSDTAMGAGLLSLSAEHFVLLPSFSFPKGVGQCIAKAIVSGSSAATERGLELAALDRQQATRLQVVREVRSAPQRRAREILSKIADVWTETELTRAVVQAISRTVLHVRWLPVSLLKILTTMGSRDFYAFLFGRGATDDRTTIASVLTSLPIWIFDSLPPLVCPHELFTSNVAHEVLHGSTKIRRRGVLLAFLDRSKRIRRKIVGGFPTVSRSLVCEIAECWPVPNAQEIGAFQRALGSGAALDGLIERFTGHSGNTHVEAIAKLLGRCIQAQSAKISTYLESKEFGSGACASPPSRVTGHGNNDEA